jgi:hypothetical protein
MKSILKESGIRNINKLAQRYKKAKIYYHMDLDGVTTALAMKNYLEKNGIKVVDAELIQYGDKEWSIKKADAHGEVMPVLVDFAHGKPMFEIHTDHHDTQAGVEAGTSTNFRPSRSNVETISQVVSPSLIFPDEDVQLISIVDSANFAVNKITPEMVMNYLFKFDPSDTSRANKMKMGLVANKLLLAFKNKPGFLDYIVMNTQPSLLSILNNIKKQIKDKGYANTDELTKNREVYIEKQKQSGEVKRLGNIIVQYGGGNMREPGSYDRYTPFKNNPDADFIVIAWPLGLVQASCNPFKEDRALKGVDLGEMKDVVLSKFESLLKDMKITFGEIKRLSEFKTDYSSVGFTYKDFVALYGNRESFSTKGVNENILKIIENISTKLYRTLSDKQKELLNKISINGWDIVQANSGGHKCITNISGLSYLYRNNPVKFEMNTPDEVKPILNYLGTNKFVNDLQYKYNKFGSLSDKQIEAAMKIIEKENQSIGSEGEEKEPEIRTYVELTKAIQREFVRVLNDEIEKQNTITESLRKKKVISEAKDPFKLSKKEIEGYINSGKKQMGYSEDEVKEEIEHIIKSIKSLPEEIKLFRIIKADDRKDIDTDKPGDHYAKNKKDLLDSHSFADGTGDNSFMITVLAPKNLVDFKETLHNNLLYPNENEITLKNKGKGVKIVSIRKISNKKEVNEKWSQKYKKSINCSNPKGFSQRAHCQGKKKRGLNENEEKSERILKNAIKTILKKELKSYLYNNSKTKLFIFGDNKGENNIFGDNKGENCLGYYDVKNNSLAYDHKIMDLVESKIRTRGWIGDIFKEAYREFFNEVFKEKGYNVGPNKRITGANIVVY